MQRHHDLTPTSYSRLSGLHRRTRLRRAATIVSEVFAPAVLVSLFLVVLAVRFAGWPAGLPRRWSPRGSPLRSPWPV